MIIDLKVGDVVLISGTKMKHTGGGRFVPLPAEPVLVKRFDDVGGPLSGQPVQGPLCT